MMYHPDRGYSRIPRFIPLVDEHIAFLRDEMELAETTCRNKATGLRNFLHFLQDVKHLDLGPENVDKEQAVEYLVWTRDVVRNADATRASKAICLKGFYRWLFSEGHVRENRMQELIIPRIASRLPRPIPYHQIEMILGSLDRTSYASLRDLALIELLYGSGLRCSEALNLRFENITWYHRDLGSHIEVMGKGKKPRLVPLTIQSGALIGELTKLRGQVYPSDLVFTSKNSGRPYLARTFRRRLKTLLARLDLPLTISPHCFRHSFATDLLAAGVPIHIIAELMGHEDLGTTQIYTKIHPLEAFRAYKAAQHRERLKIVPKAS